jgi:predicted esterase
VKKPAACLLLILQSLLHGCWDNGSIVVASDTTPQTGEVTLMSSGSERKFYLIVPADYDPSQAVKPPLLFAYHGTGGSYDAWLNGYYDLLGVVGDEAIIVLPQAQPDTNDVNQWNYPDDLQYFQDMFAYVEEGLSFDKDRVFVTGHSSGGGMAHELGCTFGEQIRGIAVHAGILRSTECVGAVAVLQTHGEYDTLVPAGTGEAGHQFWVLYNGFEYGVSTEGIRPFCIDHSLGGSLYPVQWCLHQEGEGVEAHNWPSFASAATWEFFSSLSPVAESADPPVGGGNDKVANLFDTTLAFTLVYPEGIGQVTQGSVGLYPAGTTTPSGGPDAILQLSFDPGAVGPGSTQHYEVPIKYTNQTFPGTYAFAIVIYVANGGNPIPFNGVDHIILTDVNVVDRNTMVEIVPELLLHPVGR